LVPTENEHTQRASNIFNVLERTKEESKISEAYSSKLPKPCKTEKHPLCKFHWLNLTAIYSGTLFAYPSQIRKKKDVLEGNSCNSQE
jgi:hypothetical protein